MSGSYRPADYEPGDPFPAPAPTPTGNVPFGTFNGTNPNGTWSLYVVDDRGVNFGSINSWDLHQRQWTAATATSATSSTSATSVPAATTTSSSTTTTTDRRR